LERAIIRGVGERVLEVEKALKKLFIIDSAIKYVILRNEKYCKKKG